MDIWENCKPHKTIFYPSLHLCFILEIVIKALISWKRSCNVLRLPSQFYCLPFTGHNYSFPAHLETKSLQTFWPVYKSAHSWAENKQIGSSVKRVELPLIRIETQVIKQSWKHHWGLETPFWKGGGSKMLPSSIISTSTVLQIHPLIFEWILSSEMEDTFSVKQTLSADLSWTKKHAVSTKCHRNLSLTSGNT